MASTTNAAREAQRPNPRQQAQRQRQRRRAVTLGVAALAGAAVVGIALGQAATPPTDKAVGDDIAIAAALAGVAPNQISPSTQGIHVVYPSLAPLPSSAAPRPDDKITLLMLGATWCPTCKVMAPIVSPTVAKHSGQLALVEKDIDREPALASQFRIFGTPTFVLLDPTGREIGRLPPDNNPQRWEGLLLQAAGL